MPERRPRDVEAFCEGLRRRVREETGLIASVGAGSGKQIAKIASGLAKPDGIRVVARAEEQSLLGGLPVRRLWGIGPVAEEKLNRLGIETIGQLAALADAEVANILGATVGPALHRLARGIDDRPVAERAEAKQISAESTFAADLTSLEQLHEAIDPIAEHAHQRLLRDGRGARTVTVKLKKSDMSTLTRSATLPYATTEAGALVAMARRLLLDPLPDRAHSPSRRWVFGVERGAAGVVVPGPGALDAGAGAAPSGRDSVRGDVRVGSGSHAVAGGRRRHASRFRARLGAGRRARRGHRALRDSRVGPGAGPDVRRRLRHGDLTSANPIDSLDWPDYVGVLRTRRSQPQRPMTSATGSPAASAAISSTRVCGGGSRGTITAPASAIAWPGP